MEMHFEGEAFEGLQLKVKAEESGGKRVPPSISELLQAPDPASLDNFLQRPLQLQSTLQSSVSPISVYAVDEILQKVHNLSALEKLLLYLKLPTGKEHPDPLKQPLNPLGSRVELSQTITWIKTHLKVDKKTSLPKQEVYDEYSYYCNMYGMKPVSTADFGKVMKQVYPDVRPRRLGTRGNSKYCYSGMTKRTHLPSPKLPNVAPSPQDDEEEAICNWASTVLGSNFSNLSDLHQHIVKNNLVQNPHPNGDAFISSCKIAKPVDSPNVHRKSVDIEFTKRKTEDDSTNSSNKTSPENCKGKKSRRTPSKSKAAAASASGGGGEEGRPCSSQAEKPVKLPIPRLPKIRAEVTGSCGVTAGVKKQKLLQPKEAQELVENGNSLEQEEEVAKYFEIKKEEEGKISQLRMLLEKTPAHNRPEKRVSFEGGSTKKFSFVPISPAVVGGPPSLLQSMLEGRCHSLPPTTPHLPLFYPLDTPVPSELLDFNTDSESATFLDDNLSNIFGLNPPSSSTSTPLPPSKGGDPVVSGFPSLPPPSTPIAPPPPLTLLDDPLDLGEDSFDDFTREIAHISTGLMPTDI